MVQKPLLAYDGLTFAIGRCPLTQMTALFNLGYPASDYESERASYRGTSMQDFYAAYPDDVACLTHVFKTRFGATPICPKCSRGGRWYHIKGTRRLQHPCGQGIWPLTDTIFERSNIPLQLWFYAMLHFANSATGVPTTFLRRHLGLTVKATYRLADRIRMHMAALDYPSRVGQPGKPVEIRIEYLLGVSTTRYPVLGSAKAVLLGDANSVQATVIGRARRHILTRLMADKLVEGAVPVTSCEYTHRVLSEFGARSPAVPLVDNFIDPSSGVNPISSFLTFAKRPMNHVYRRVDYGNLWKYLKEMEFRFNRRFRSHKIFPDLTGAFPDLSAASRLQLEAWSSRSDAIVRKSL